MPHRQNYVERMKLTKQNRLASGLLSDLFPGVSGIQIQMTYYQNGANPVLMLRTLHMLPVDSAYFNMECMIKGCDGGGFDLSSIIAALVKAHKKVGKGRLTCCGKIDSRSFEHGSVSYEIEIGYHKGSR